MPKTRLLTELANSGLRPGFEGRDGMPFTVEFAFGAINNVPAVAPEAVLAVDKNTMRFIIIIHLQSENSRLFCRDVYG